ncbi:hypothetical protein Nmel_003709 [Mimus melanotis]
MRKMTVMRKKEKDHGGKGDWLFPYFLHTNSLPESAETEKVLLCDVPDMIQLFYCWQSEPCENGGVKIEVDMILENRLRIWGQQCVYVACSIHMEVFRTLKTYTIIFSLPSCLLFFDEEYQRLTAKALVIC